MNKARRKQLGELFQRIELLKMAVENLPDADELHGDAEAVRDEEQETFDGLPESLQTDDRREPCEQLDTATGKLEEIATAITTLVDDLQEVLDAIDAAKGGQS